MRLPIRLKGDCLMRSRWIKFAAVLGFLILAWSQQGFAAEEAKHYSWLDKLQRGAVNIVTSPVEIAREIHLTTNEKNLLAGWTVGLLKGFGQGFVRLGAGVIDLVTFPFNIPDSQKGPLIDPEYVWQKPGLKYV